jgi:hypothetical protein
MANTTKAKKAPLTQAEIDTRKSIATVVTDRVQEMGFNAQLVTSKYGAFLTLIDFGEGNYLRAIVLLDGEKLPVINLLTGNGETKGKIWQSIIRHDKVSYLAVLDALLSVYQSQVADKVDVESTLPTTIVATPSPVQNVTVQATVS